MKSIKLMLMAAAIFSFQNLQAQTNFTASETVKINGNCGMCKTTIEKAGNVKGESEVVWDKTSKTATLNFDASKTSEEAILKRIALAGYDNEKFLAPTAVYEKLPGCCRYDREMKMDDMPAESAAMDHSDHSAHQNMEMKSEVKATPLSAVYKHYFSLKNALVQSNSETAAAEAASLQTAIKAVPMEKLSSDLHMAWMKDYEAMAKASSSIAQSKDLAQQRKLFIDLSNNMYKLTKLDKLESPVYYQFCPMANSGKGAYWLSQESNIKNPYYGSKMMTCGSVKETIQ